MKIFSFFRLLVRLWERIGEGIIQWLIAENDKVEIPPTDFKQMCYEMRPGDVILVEGRSRVAEIIKIITQSSWTHSMLYIGHLHDIKSAGLREIVEHHYQGDPTAALVVESLLGEGTMVNPLIKYQHDHLRICRPSGITPQDANKVIAYSIRKLGTLYHVRQLLDLARFLFPYQILPRRWRSSLFLENTNITSQTVCSTMISEAFQSIKFPILPVKGTDKNGEVSLYMRNPRLFTPKDFDYSPYFEIIKYPVYGFDHLAKYKQMPWDTEGLICHEPGNCYLPEPKTDTAIAAKVPFHHRLNLLNYIKLPKLKKLSAYPDYTHLWHNQIIEKVMNKQKNISNQISCLLHHNN